MAIPGSVEVGSAHYTLDLDDKKFTSGIRNSRTAIGELGKNISTVGDRIGNFGQEMSSIGSEINRRVLPAALAIAGGIGAVGTMAFRQVSMVEQATVALNAYEKDAGKVNQVLSELLEFARSDLGVLFMREDLFAAAQGLKVMGAETENLNEFVQIMSRSVGLGLSTWDDLGRVIGRVGSTGRLTGIDFDNLTKAGFSLDDSLRNTDITFNELFENLDKGIPADAMAGQANTIVGLGIRMQTAFRGIGNAILGVDKDTSQFIEGGAGHQLVELMRQIPEILREPEMQEGFRNLGQSIADFAKVAVPVMIDFVKWLGRNADTVVKVISFLLIFGTTMKVVGGIVSSIGTLVKVLGLTFQGAGVLIKGIVIVAKIVGVAIAAVGAPVVILGALVATLAYILITKWDLIKSGAMALKEFVVARFNDLINFFRNIPNMITSALGGVVGAITQPFKSAFDGVKNMAGGVRETLSKINPFSRQSPSLVDQVKKGVGVIKDEYMSLSDLRIPRATGVVDTGANAPTTQNITINVDKVGDMQDVRAIGRELGFRAGLEPGMMLQ